MLSRCWTLDYGSFHSAILTCLYLTSSNNDMRTFPITIKRFKGVKMDMNRDDELDDESEYKWQLFRVVLFVACLVIMLLIA